MEIHSIPTLIMLWILFMSSFFYFLLRDTLHFTGTIVVLSSVRGKISAVGLLLLLLRINDSETDFI